MLFNTVDELKACLSSVQKSQATSLLTFVATAELLHLAPSLGLGLVQQLGSLPATGAPAHLHAATLTEPEASALLLRDVQANYGAHMAARLTRAVTQNQFDALVSLCFNIGTASFDQSSVLHLANAGSNSTVDICTAFSLWNKVTNPRTKQKEISQGLTVRHAHEASLYLAA